MKKYTVPKKIMRIYIGSLANLRLAEIFDKRSFFRLLARKYFVLSKEQHIEFMRKMFNVYPELETYYDNGSSISIDTNLGNINIKEQQNGTENKD